MTRPPASSLEFATYFENIVKTSKSRGEATRRLGYYDASMVYHHLRRLGIQTPPEWSKRPDVSLRRQQNVPEIIITTSEGRSWVGALTQGEGCIQSHYQKRGDSTTIDLTTGMTDPAPIFKLSDYYRLTRPTRPKINHNWKPVWTKTVSGLRAFRILGEILPFLVGQKLKEAERALDFFSPDGYHWGCFRANDIWPLKEFPLRRRGPPRKDSLHQTGLPVIPK